MKTPLRPATLGLFEKRFEGDDALLELARLRFRQAGMGAEMHAGVPEQLNWVMRFRPWPEAPVVVHLPRDYHLALEQTRGRIAEFAAGFAGRIAGLVIHDHPDVASRPEEYRRAAQEMDAQLGKIQDSPMLFVEYATGLEPNVFADFFDAIHQLTHLSACIDVGHVGIRQVRNAYAAGHSGQDICGLKDRAGLAPELLFDVQAAVSTALPRVLSLIQAVGSLGKPLHFHLHDGHPLSTFSPFGVSDHLSFFAEIPINFEYHGRRSLPLMFGPAGLARIVAKALEGVGGERVSFTLEIHPPGGQLPLADAAGLFAHWRDKTNAERMNNWLAVLGQNHQLLHEQLAKNVF